MEIGRRTSKDIQRIKRTKITSQPVLALLKKKGKFRVETDASGHAIGRVLFQE